jgi:asparagine synthase (glutamine-hydrolysing)
VCGIYASAGLTPEKARIDCVAHRGPDGDGWQVFETPRGPVALGHRRLAIIDTSDDGLQPFCDEAGRYHLVYNGEIYNYRELRTELESFGERFTTATDTEVLLRALMRWGTDALPRLIGMFAFVLHDAAEQSLLAVRDRFGIKPLYVTRTTAGVAFGSEIKQLLRFDDSSPQINLARVGDFLLDGISDHTAETMFTGITQVRGGEWVKAEASAAVGDAPWIVTRQRWYEAAMPSVRYRPAAEAAEEFRALLADSVRMHLRSDVPVGSCLSGGLDSSSIVGLMAGLLGAGEGIHTVTACYAERAVDERAFAEMVITKTGANGRFVYPAPEDVFRVASDLTWAQDEPFGSTSIFAQWSVFAEARAAGIKVMLDGQGADEQLAGYHGLFGLRLKELLRSARLIELARTQIERRRWHGTALLPPLRQIARGLRHGHAPAGLPGWLSGDVAAALHGRESSVSAAADALGLADPVGVADTCNLLVHGSNLPMLLHWEDRNSMAHGIEARVPFLDHRLVEFSLGLAPDNKFSGGDTKRVLRDAMIGVLPEAVRQRRDKLGFATPEQVWLQGPLRGLALDGIELTLRRFPGLFDGDALRQLAGGMLDGTVPFSFQLWRIISLGFWGERFGL